MFPVLELSPVLLIRKDPPTPTDRLHTSRLLLVFGFVVRMFVFGVFVLGSR